MSHKSNYMFTNKNHPEKGIMSSILGVISIASIWITVYLTFQNKGQAEFRYGTVVFLTMIFSFIGMGLGVSSRMEKDKFYFFSYMGIFLICYHWQRLVLFYMQERMDYDGRAL